jgi:EpsI family protein
MRARARLAASGLALLLPALLLARWQAAGGATKAAIGALPLPDAIGPWMLVEEQRLSVDHFAMLAPDAHVWRLYEAEGRAPIWAYVAFYAGRAGYQAGAHDPEVCYPAQGWEILGSRPFDVSLGGDERLRARLLGAHRGSARQSVLYWFQPAGRWPAGAALEQLVRVLDALAGRPQYAFVRLSAPADARLDGAGDLAEFAARIARPVRAALEPEDAGPGGVSGLRSGATGNPTPTGPAGPRRASG